MKDIIMNSDSAKEPLLVKNQNINHIVNNDICHKKDGNFILNNQRAE